MTRRRRSRTRAKTGARPKAARAKTRTPATPAKKRARVSRHAISKPTAVTITSVEPEAVARSAEPMLLHLARDLTDRGHGVDSPAQFHDLVAHAFAAYAPDMPLAAALREDWLRGRGDKSAALSLGWAREQVRLALVDALVRARSARLVRADPDLDTLAWLWLAACESLAHEVPGAASDRVQAFAAFLGAT